MASIDVGIHPDPAGITTKYFPGGPPASFSTLEFVVGGAKAACIFVNSRAVLDALQAALDAIRADFDVAKLAEVDDGPFGDPAIVGSNGHPEYREPDFIPAMAS